MATTFYVYKHTFSNGAVYVGKGSCNRAYKFSGRNDYWQKLRKKYGKPVVDILHNNLSESTAFELEIKLIKQYEKMGFILCNLVAGGKGTSGLRHSDCSKKKIGDSSANRQMGKLNGNYNDTLYTLQHKEYGVVTNTIYNFYKTYNLTRSSLYRVINGERKTVSGFKLLK